MDVRSFTVGPFAENTYFVRRDGADKALVVDPGDEAPRLLAAIDELGLDVEAILLTHTHVDHVGAVPDQPVDAIAPPDSEPPSVTQ